MGFAQSKIRCIATLALAAAALAACKEEAPPAFKMPPPAVTAITAVARDVPVYIDEIGRMTPSEMVNMQAQVGGQITKLNFVDGQQIKSGDLLFTIDPRPYQAQVDQAEANLVSAKAQLELAQADYARILKALPLGAATHEDVDTKKANLDTAAAQIKIDEAAITTAKLNVEYATVNSPITGRASARMVDMGNMVKPNETTVLTVQNMTPIYADFTITERDLPLVREKMRDNTLTAQVSLPQSPDKSSSGDLTFLDTTVQPNAGRIQLRATIPNTDLYFWPGQFVKVRLILETQKDAVLIPYGCTQMGQQGPYVYVVKPDGTAEQRPITVGQRQGGDDDFIVVTGVKAGEQVVRTGQLSVSPGAPVTVIPPAPPAPGANHP